MSYVEREKQLIGEILEVLEKVTLRGTTRVKLMDVILQEGCKEFEYQSSRNSR